LASALYHRWPLTARLRVAGSAEVEATSAKLPPVPDARHPRILPIWSAGVLACSYALLVPGLSFRIFSYEVTAAGGSLDVVREGETMIGFARQLVEFGSWFGGAMVVLYAMVVPALKLLLLLAVQVLVRRHARPGPPPRCSEVRAVRLAVVTLRQIGKWASPDMFAYVLLIHLIRGLDKPPYLGSVAALETGFTCFSVFCVLSSAASLGLRVPCGGPAREPWAPPVPKRAAPHWAILPATAALAASFAGLLAWGLLTPCMALRLDLEVLYEPAGPIPELWRPILEQLDLPRLASADVSVWGTIEALSVSCVRNGHTNDFIGLFLYAFMVVALASADMFALLLAAWAAATGRVRAAAAARRASKVLKKLCMLEVAVVGVALVVICGQVYRKYGIALSYRKGLGILALAEVCHYAAFAMVQLAGRRSGAEGVPAIASKPNLAEEDGKPEAETQAHEASTIDTLDVLASQTEGQWYPVVLPDAEACAECPGAGGDVEGASV